MHNNANHGQVYAACKVDFTWSNIATTATPVALSTGAIAGIAVAGVAFCVLVPLLIFFLWRRGKHSSKELARLERELVQQNSNPMGIYRDSDVGLDPKVLSQIKRLEKVSHNLF